MGFGARQWGRTAVGFSLGSVPNIPNIQHSANAFPLSFRASCRISSSRKNGRQEMEDGRWERKSRKQKAAPSSLLCDFQIRSRVDHGRSRVDHGSDLQNTLISLDDHGITSTGTPITPRGGKAKRLGHLSSLVVLCPASSCLKFPRWQSRPFRADEQRLIFRISAFCFQNFSV